MGDTTSYKLYKDRVELQFTDSSHRYKVSVDGSNFTPVRGVTGIIDSFIPKPFLISWAAGLAADTFRDGLTQVLIADAYERDEVIKTLHMTAKKAHTVRKERGGDIGTQVHNYIEAYLAGKNPQEPSEPEVNRAVRGFRDFINKNRVKFESAEQPVYSLEHNYAGTYDVIMTLNNKRYMTDWKSSDPMKVYKGGKPTGEVKAYPNHIIQCAAYDLAYSEEKGTDNEFDGHAVIYVTKSGKVYPFYNHDTKENKQAFIDGLNLSKRLKELEVK